MNSKRCPQCQALLSATAPQCDLCGYAFRDVHVQALEQYAARYKLWTSAVFFGLLAGGVGFLPGFLLAAVGAFVLHQIEMKVIELGQDAKTWSRQARQGAFLHAFIAFMACVAAGLWIGAAIVTMSR